MLQLAKILQSHRQSLIPLGLVPRPAYREISLRECTAKSYKQTTHSHPYCATGFRVGPVVKGIESAEGQPFRCLRLLYSASEAPGAASETL